MYTSVLLFIIQSAEQTQDADFFSPPLLLQDRCERSWQSRSTCIPAIAAHRGPIHNFRSSFQTKIVNSTRRPGAFIVTFPQWRIPAVCVCFDAPPASPRIADTAASAAVAAAPHRGGRPLRHAPLWREKATSHMEKEDPGALIGGLQESISLLRWLHQTTTEY